MIRFYVLPIEVVDNGNGTNSRGPKYFLWPNKPPLSISHPGIVSPYGVMRYGLIPACLVAAEVTQEQHDSLAANPDVASPPENIDQNIGTGAIPQVQNVLEALRIPADWVTTDYTYRQILRMVAGLFQFAQRHQGLWKEPLIDSVDQLGIRWNQIPSLRRGRIQATADSLGYDYSAIAANWLVRRILKHLGDQWGERVLHLAVTDL